MLNNNIYFFWICKKNMKMPQKEKVKLDNLINGLENKLNWKLSNENDLKSLVLLNFWERGIKNAKV